MEGHSSDSSKHKLNLVKVAHDESSESEEQKSIPTFYCLDKYKPLEIEDNDKGSTIDDSSPHKNSEKENKEERTILIAKRSLNFCSSDMVKKAKTLLNSPVAKKQILSPNDDVETYINTKFNRVSLDPSCSTETPSPSCSKDLPGPSSSSNTSDLSILTHLQTSSSLIGYPTSSNANMYSSHLTIDQELINDFYKKTLIYEPNEQLPKINDESNESVEATPLERCNLIQDQSKIGRIEDTDVDTESDNSEPFVDDPDVVNPEIMYNIDLNEHYKYMESLVEMIREAPDNPNMLNKCTNLKPIPKVEHEPQTFTARERFNFINGISEWEYEIDSEHWNTIMVKRAVIFTTHAGFSVANEESLYVLAEVATDYIKKLALVMKKHIDIQSISSYPESIDPINFTLQEIGVLDGIKELVKHYEDDIFDRRDKLRKKCLQLQKVINVYVERLQPSCQSSKQGVTEQNSKTIEHINKKPKIKNDRNATTKENSLLKIGLKQTDTVIRTDLVDIVGKNSKSIEPNKTSHSVSSCKKTETIDLLKPLNIKPFNYNVEHSIFNVEERYLNIKHLESRDPKLFNAVDCSISKEIIVKEELSPSSLSDNDDERKKLINLPENEKIDKRTLEFCRMLKNFDDNANNQSNVVKIEKTQSENAKVVLVPNESVLVHDSTDNNEESHLTTDNTEDKNENSDDDLVYVGTYFVNDDCKE